MLSHRERTDLYEAIDAYVVACGGDPKSNTGTLAKRVATDVMERMLEELVKSDEVATERAEDAESRVAEAEEDAAGARLEIKEKELYATGLKVRLDAANARLEELGEEIR